MIPLLILITGLVLLFATSYDVLGIALVTVGGTILLVGLVFLLAAGIAVGTALRSQPFPRRVRARRRRP